MYASNWVHVYTKLKFWTTENLIWNIKSPQPQAKQISMLCYSKYSNVQVTLMFIQPNNKKKKSKQPVQIQAVARLEQFHKK